VLETTGDWEDMQVIVKALGRNYLLMILLVDLNFIVL